MKKEHVLASSNNANSTHVLGAVLLIEYTENNVFFSWLRVEIDLTDMISFLARD